MLGSIVVAVVELWQIGQFVLNVDAAEECPLGKGDNFIYYSQNFHKYFK
jgi:hypothetical protein